METFHAKTITYTPTPSITDPRVRKRMKHQNLDLRAFGSKYFTAIVPKFKKQSEIGTHIFAYCGAIPNQKITWMFTETHMYMIMGTIENIMFNKQMRSCILPGLWCAPNPKQEKIESRSRVTTNRIFAITILPRLKQTYRWKSFQSDRRLRGRDL